MSGDLMRYDAMTREALRDVVRKALKRVAREGALPGKHHFYVTFLTRAPGVDIDPELADRYPKDMTIVLEHQFWDLSATDDGFEVTLKFGGVPKYLSVPYAAITRFQDPSVRFALQFDVDAAPKANGALAKDPEADLAEEIEEKPKPEGGGEVVSLDAFRKNT